MRTAEQQHCLYSKLRKVYSCFCVSQTVVMVLTLFVLFATVAFVQLPTALVTAQEVAQAPAGGPTPADSPMLLLEAPTASPEYVGVGEDEEDKDERDMEWQPSDVNAFFAPAPGPAPDLNCSTIEGVIGGMSEVELFSEREYTLSRN